MNRILCPTDFSDASLDAYNFASQFALTMQADLLLYHVENKFFHGQEPVVHEPGKISDEMMEKNRQLLVTWQKLKNSESEKGKRIHYDFIVEPGFPVEAIVRSVEKHGVDMIIMHTRGIERRKYEGVFLGSVAAQVIEDTSCPVLLVPAGITHEHIRTIVYAINLKSYSLTSVKKAITITRCFGAHLIFLYLNDMEEDNLIEDFKRKLTFEIENKHVSVESIPTGKDFVKTIDRFLQKHNSDMLMMERQDKSVLKKLLDKNLIREMALHTRIPMMIFV